MSLPTPADAGHAGACALLVLAAVALIWATYGLIGEIVKQRSKK